MPLSVVPPVEPATDPVDAAIAATDTPAEVRMAQLDLSLPSGRPFRMAMPIDYTDLEALQAVQALLIGMDRIRQAQPASRIIIPGR